MSEKLYTITESEYRRLLNNSEKLDRLEAMGVDCWCGYEEAFSDDYFDTSIEEEVERILKSKK